MLMFEPDTKGCGCSVRRPRGSSLLNTIKAQVYAHVDAGYPTTLEQDRATAAVRSPDPNQRFGRTREQNAAAIRVAERQILARTQFIASSRAREMRKSGRRK